MLQAPFFYKTTPESSLHVIAPPLELVVLALDPVPGYSSARHRCMGALKKEQGNGRSAPAPHSHKPYNSLEGALGQAG